MLDLLPEGAVFQNSLGFPRSLIFTAGESGSAAGETVRGAVDRLTWGVGDTVVQNDFEPPLISVADATVAEPAAGTAFAEVQVSLSGLNGFRSPDAPRAGRLGQPVTVHYETADDTATAGEDYTPVSGTLTFDPADSVTSQSVTIPILNDTAADDGETFQLKLSAPVNGVLESATATITITNTPPTSPTDVVVRPGALHGWAVDFSAASVRPGFVTGPADAPLGEGSFRFDTGSAGAAAAGAKVELSSGGLNDQPVVDLGVLRFDLYVEEVIQGGIYLNLKVDADHNGTIDTTLSYVPAAIPLKTWTRVDALDGGATGAFGWFCQSSTVTCSQSGITWTAMLDLLPGGAEFQNSLGFPRSLIFSAGTSASAAGDTVRGAVDLLTWGLGDSVVQNDFEPPLIAIADATVAEPEAGNTVASLAVTLSGPNGFFSPDAPRAGRLGQPVTVHYATDGGTATAGQDYTSVAGTLTFNPGQTTASASVPISADRVADNNETVLVRLSTPVNGVIQRATATLTITDTPPPGEEPGYVPLSPVRLLDTRDGTGAPAGFVDAGSVTEVQVSGAAGIPGSAKAVVLNATVTQPEAAGFVTVFPCGESRPTTSSINHSAGQTIPNMVVVALPDNGKICFYSSKKAHLIADVNGYFSQTSDFEPMSPRRLVDTRSSVTPPVKVPAGSTFSVNVAPRYGIPEGAAAASLNLTVTQTTSSGFVTMFPCGSPRPTASTLNFVAGQTISNAVLAKAGSGGNVCIYTTDNLHVLVDVGGWFPADTDFRSLTPERLLDSRSGIGHPPAGIVTGGSEVELKVTQVGASNIPADAGAVVLNVTATGPQSGGFVTVYPCGQPRPTASNLNYTKGTTIANAVISKVGAGGKVCLYTPVSTHLVADVTGWFPTT